MAVTDVQTSTLNITRLQWGLQLFSTVKTSAMSVLSGIPVRAELPHLCSHRKPGASAKLWIWDNAWT